MTNIFLIILFIILSPPVLAQSQIDPIRTYLKLGRTDRARELLEPLKSDNSPLVLATFGHYYYLVKDYKRAIDYYNQSLKIENNPDVLTSLGATYWSRHQNSQRLLLGFQGIVNPQLINRLKTESASDRQQALSIWQQVLKVDSNQAKASLYLAKADPKYLPQAETVVNQLPNHAAKVPFLLNLAELSGNKNLLELALSLAQDPRTVSWIYYQQGTIPSLKEALNLAESLPAYDLLWRYQWKLADLYGEAGDQKREQIFLEFAVATAQNLQVSPTEIEIKTSLEPLYKKLATIYLKNGELKKGQEMIELLQISQLQSFLLENCFTGITKSLAPLSASIATIETLVTDRGTFVIIEKSGRLNSYLIPISSAEMKKKVATLRTALQDFNTEKYIAPAQELYDLIIAPLKPQLTGVDQLVFNNDPILSTIPYSVLYDGKKFLIEDFAITYSAGIISRNIAPKKQSSTLLVSISDPPAPWSSLPYASLEVNAIASFVPLSVKTEQKTFVDFEKVQTNFNTIHIATHSQLAVDINQSTIVFADREVTMQEFAEVLASRSQPIDLLVLSGCQTGVGDSRSVLGLAGIAAKNQVNKVLASLWGVNDSDTAKLMSDFYRARQSGVSDGFALQMAQKQMLEDPDFHPASWSSFVLVQN
jgi:CHAT domain-containing protein